MSGHKRNVQPSAESTRADLLERLAKHSQEPWLEVLADFWENRPTAYKIKQLNAEQWSRAVRNVTPVAGYTSHVEVTETKLDVAAVIREVIAGAGSPERAKEALRMMGAPGLATYVDEVEPAVIDVTPEKIIKRRKPK